MAIASPPQAPELSIRAHAPSPRRLSRKVLLAGATVAASVVTLALFYGLSAPPRDRAAPADVTAAGGPPESIRNAAAQYADTDFGPTKLKTAKLEPPRDRLWGDHPHPAMAAPDAPQDGAEAGAGVSQARAPDPEMLAQKSPILFANLAGSQPDPEHGAAGNDGARLDTKLEPPRSRFEVIAGTVIPAALVTALNADLPGAAIAQVTANVYDSVSGEHLLIPQGARLIGVYRAAPSYGERRLLLVWNRLVLPNGWSISLKGMQGTDPSGASGLRDRTDNHLGSLAGAVGLSAVISVVAENAQNDDPNSLGQSVGDAAAAEAARTGGRIVDRALEVRPTLRVRAGAPVRVLVNRDIQLRPYGQ